MKLSKNCLTDITLRLVNLYEKNLNTCKSAAIKVYQLKSNQIENQKKLLQIKDSKMGSVQQTVKTEPKICADVVKKGLISKLVTEHTVKEAVRPVNDDARRLRCLLIHGIEENDDEMPYNIFQEVCQKMNFNTPKVVDSFRVGRKNPGKPIDLLKLK